MKQTTIDFPIHTRENNAFSESVLRKATKAAQGHCALILSHLKQHGSITTWEAIQQYGITRLSGRIKDLRDAGYSIETQMNGRIGTYILKP